jgi:hypothetical protein
MAWASLHGHGSELSTLVSRVFTAARHANFAFHSTEADVALNIHRPLIPDD